MRVEETLLQENKPSLIGSDVNARDLLAVDLDHIVNP